VIQARATAMLMVGGTVGASGDIAAGVPKIYYRA